VLNTAKVGDEFQKMSQRTGVAVRSLSELAHVAEMSGTSIETVEKSLLGLQKTAVSAAGGGASAEAAFEKLGVQTTMLDGSFKSTEQLFLEVAEALKKVENETQRTVLAQEIFGKSGSQLLPIIAEGAEGIKQLRQEARELGITFSDVEANDAARFNDAMDRVKKSAEGAEFSIGKALAPTLEKFFNHWNSGFKNLFGLDEPANQIEILGKSIDGEITQIDRLNKQLQTAKEVHDITIMYPLELEIAKRREHIAALNEERALLLPPEQKSPLAGGSMGSTPDLEKNRLNAAELMAFKAQLNIDLQDIEKQNIAANEELRQQAIDAEISQYMLAFDQEYNAQITQNERLGLLAIDRNRRETKIYSEDLDALNKIEKLKKSARETGASNAMKILENLNTLAEGKHREWFMFLKIARMAEVVINTYAGAARALADYPWPYSAVVAGSVIALGLSQLAVISSQSFESSGSSGGSSGGVSSGGGSAPVTSMPTDSGQSSSQQTNEPAQQWTIVIQNPLGNEDWDQIAEDNIIPAMRRAAGRNVQVN
jgi:hypothetical protein